MLITCNGPLEGFLLHDLVAFLVLHLGVLVVGLHLHHRLVVAQGGPELAQGHVAGCAAVVTLDVLLVHLDGPCGVGQRVAVALGAQVGQAAVAIVDGIAWVQLYGLTVELDGVLVVLGFEVVVGQVLAPLISVPGLRPTRRLASCPCRALSALALLRPLTLPGA